jgi:hypothetical protein
VTWVWFLGLLAGTLSGELPEKSLEELLDLLDKADSRGDPVLAIEVFEELSRRGCGGCLFHIRQGNAYLAAGRIAEAIWAYRHAERYCPRHQELRTNLAQARSLVPEHQPSKPVRWPREAKLWWHELPIAGATLWLLGWGVLCVRPFRRLPIAWQLGGWFLVAGGGLLGFLGWLGSRQLAEPWAVVREDGVWVRRGNGLSYPAVEAGGNPVALPRGYEVRVMALRPNGWVQIQLRDATVGWVPLSSLLLGPHSPRPGEESGMFPPYLYPARKPL